MELFFGTLIIVVICCGAMALGPLLSGKPLPGGCGKKQPGSEDCTGCSRHANEIWGQGKNYR
jgi:hypothetical protein